MVGLHNGHPRRLSDILARPADIGIVPEPFGWTSRLREVVGVMPHSESAWAFGCRPQTSLLRSITGQQSGSKFLWLDELGHSHEFDVYDIRNLPDCDDVIYVTAQRLNSGIVTPRYVGITGRGLLDRLSDQGHKISSAIALGANEVHILRVPSSARRAQIEESLIRRYGWTLLNITHNPHKSTPEVLRHRY